MKRTLRTVALMWDALLPARGGIPEPVEPGVLRRCDPADIRGGMGRYLDASGELRLLVPDCRGLAAPFVLFRLKREGFSRCSVRVVEDGLLIQARR
ncbi:hypothetical protein KP001_17265 [Geomonas subterranea]|uniref:Uncharacterized protein n=1 Tax=Geomonas subterranea TaxID=2847989 RepID=A0ABX8LHJ8_9BACT|nr:hypothetical protein [Geomonas subterranea]QXE90149.1 hypothetical protein KP001_17265 [Geomonas subterranea]QXM07725.1 hypothetical protein KP002_12015 [Geomonas subterranea]